jgi:hypothetical protein
MFDLSLWLVFFQNDRFDPKESSNLDLVEWIQFNSGHVVLHGQSLLHDLRRSRSDLRSARQVTALALDCATPAREMKELVSDFPARLSRGDIPHRRMRDP